MISLNPLRPKFSFWYRRPSYPNWVPQTVGISGLALSWFKSFWTNRMFSFTIGNSMSSTAGITYRVPQGTILGTILPLGHIIHSQNVSFTNDRLFYLDLMILPLCKRNYLKYIESWLPHTFFYLPKSKSKTEIVLFRQPIARNLLFT